ncbi:MAG: penicillin-binding protein 2 [Dehalococcoidia bacterium]
MSILDEGFRAPGGTSRNRPHGNLGILRIAVVGLFLLLGVRLAQMQIVDGAAYAQRSKENHIYQKNILPTRGLIFDRNGEPLVQNVGVYSATILPEALPGPDTYDNWKDMRYKMYLKLEELTGTSSLEIQSRVDDAEEAGLDYIAIKVADNLTKEQALALDEIAAEMPGVSLEITPGRLYLGNEFSHILGYIGPQFKEDAARLEGQGYEYNEPIGKDGLEKQYESDLRGTVGHTAVEQDAFGRQITALQSRDPVPGNSLKLAIDAPLQKYIAELLQDSLPDSDYGTSHEAAAVVMDPNTGKVLAMVSIPTYDNNIWAESKIRGAELDALQNDNFTHTLTNKALSGAAPGSTFKIVTSTAGLEEGSITPNTSRYVGCSLEITGENNVIYTYPDWQCHNKVLDVRSALAWSSNVFMFLTAGGDLETTRGLGKSVEDSGAILATWARRFGFGSPTGIDLPGEGSGRVPDPAWKKRTYVGPGFNPGENDWFIGDTYNTAIGQGDVLATPLQVARMTAAIANGGKLVTPHLVDSIIAPDGETVRTIQPEFQDVGMSKETAQVIGEGMLASVQYGAGTLAQLPSVSVAGKTGTAEFYDPDTGRKTQHAWFTGFAPYGNPEVVVTVYFDKGIGGTHAAPVAAKILDYYFKNVHP